MPEPIQVLLARRAVALVLALKPVRPQGRARFHVLDPPKRLAALDDILVAKTSQTHRGGKLRIRYGPRNEILCKGEVAIVRPVTNNHVGASIRNRKASRQILLCLRRQPVLRFKLSVLKQYGKPVKEAIWLGIQVEDIEPVILHGIDVCPSVMVHPHRPFHGKFLGLGAIEATAIVIAALASAKQRLDDSLLRPMIECPIHGYVLYAYRRILVNGQNTSPQQRKPRHRTKMTKPLLPASANSGPARNPPSALPLLTRNCLAMVS